MDPTRFDALTKALGQARSRRGVLRTVGGTLGAAGLALLGRDVTLAASCSSDADCLNGHCVQGHCRFGVGGARGGELCDAKRCYSDGCCVAFGAGDRTNSCFQRFESCHRDKRFCESRSGETCCQFCAGWACDRSIVCS